MPRPAIPAEIVKEIETIWAENDMIPATKVYEIAYSKLGDKRPSLRKVQQIISAARLKARVVPQDPPVQPWGKDWPKAPDEIECMFSLMYFAYAVGAPRLDCRIAKWAIRLKSLFYDGSLNGTNYLYSWANKYARREKACAVLGQDPPFTADIDGQMVFRVWKDLESSNNLVLYLKAVEQGVYPKARDSFDDLKVLYPSGVHRILNIRGDSNA